jgi:cation:H+ antiporter
MLIFFFILGLSILSLGAELFVRGASRLAALMGISPLIIGLTVVAFGTSAPEVAVVVQAGFQDQGDMAFGNIVGSNISNFLLILGLSALISPLVVSQRLIKLEVPLLLGISVLVIVLGLDGRITTPEGLLLLIGATTYTGFVIWSCRRENRQNANKTRHRDRPEVTLPETRAGGLKSGLMLVFGLGGLILGANWLVAGASGLARMLGISELVIGLTLVAVGTSLPELATSIAATRRGERDLAIGNIIGSNLFNLTFVLGLAVVILPGGLPVPSSTIAFDLPVMLAVTLACLPIFFSDYNINRWEGLFFLSYYGAYILYLLLFSIEHDFLPRYSTLMLRYIIPLTALLLLFVLIKTVRTHQQQRNWDKRNI